jgi:hydroxyacylglutathione hydrolase
MIKIKQFGYSNDNLAYLLYAGTEAVAIDPGCPDEIIKFLKKNNLTLTMILNTHSHYDHTLGNRDLEDKTGVTATKYEDLIDLKVGGNNLDVIHTPGHTVHSVCFKTDNFIVTGDTLFIANIGKCCQDSLMSKYKESIEKLISLPDNLIVYPGHDYAEISFKRAEQAESGNKNIAIFKENYNPPPVCSTIGDEKKINPYFRIKTEEIREFLNDMGKNTSTDFECFRSLRMLY